MGFNTVNILGVELTERLDEAGFRHVATSVGVRLGARRIAASVYEAEAGAGPTEPVEVVREPPTSAPQPVVNALSDGAPARLGPLLGAERLDAAAVDLVAGEGSDPYHYIYGREEWLLVLTGTPTLRHPAGESVLEAGDVVCFPDGPAGAHQLINGGPSTARALVASTTGVPANVHYPDEERWVLHHGMGDDVEC